MVKRERLFTALVILFFVILGYGMIKALAGLWVRDGYAPEQYAQMKKYFDSPVDLPKEYYEVKTYSQPLLDAGKEVNQLYKQTDPTKIDFIVLDQLKNGAQLLEGEWGQIDSYCNNIQPFLDKLAFYVRLPGYEIGAWAIDKRDENSTIPNFLSIQVSAKALLLRAYAAANQKNWREAFESNLTVYELIKRSPGESVIGHLVSIAVEGMAVDVTLQLARACDDVDVLKKSLNEMNRLDAKINPDILLNSQVLDLISGLREFKKRDSSIDLTPGKTGRYYFRQMVDFVAQKERNQQWPEKFPELWVIKLGRYLGFGFEIDAILYKVFTPNLQTAQIRERATITNFRMAQIALASRMEELKTGKPVNRVADLVPGYFSQEPLDPFANGGKGSAFLYDETQKMFYGVGPDQIDDKNQVVYSPSNGIMSVGDISVLVK